MRRLPLVLAPFLVFACTKKEKTPAAPPVTTPGTPMEAHPTGGSPTTPTAPAAAGVSGKLLERIDAASYSYLRLQTAQGEVWAAVPETKVEVGADVTVENAMPMHNFETKTLGRTFETIYFGTLGGAGQAPAAKPMAPSIADSAPIKVEKAAGAAGRTVNEVFTQKDALKDKPVEVRGKVVKAANGIMGKNWLHVRDGSGSDAAKDNDLTVTTQDTAAVGDVVLVKGTVRINQDFGAGYVYPVIVEDATVTK